MGGWGEGSDADSHGVSARTYASLTLAHPPAALLLLFIAIVDSF